MKTCPANTVCFGLTGPISGERSHLQAPRGAYFEHLSNTSSFQVLDCSNTSSCQSNSRPYPGNPVLTLELRPCISAEVFTKRQFYKDCPDFLYLYQQSANRAQTLDS